VSKGFVPAELQNNYKNVITREQFCQMAVMYLEYATGKEIDKILSEKGLAIDPDVFADTKNEYILAASTSPPTPIPSARRKTTMKTCSCAPWRAIP